MRSQDDQLHDLIAEQAAEWYVAGAEGDLSPQQAREFMRWLRTSPVHVAEYLTLTRVANGIVEVASDDSSSLTDLLRGSQDQPIALNAGVAPGEANGDPPTHLFSPRRYYSTHLRHGVRKRGTPPLIRFGWAFAMVAVVAIVVVGLTTLPRTSPQAPGETFATQHGEVRSFHLSDGTLAQLDSDSAIAVRFDGTYRTVVVERGQAYFKVIKDSGRPFRVHAGRSVIRDIGTAFDVYRHASDTTVTVAHGKVQVWDVPARPVSHQGWLASLSLKRAVGQLVADLQAGQQVTLTPDGQVARLGNVDVERSLAWRHGRIAFDEQPIAWVAAEFNRYNNVRIEVNDPAVAALRISGTFSARDVQTFTAFLGSLPSVSVERSGATISVTASRRHR